MPRFRASKTRSGIPGRGDGPGVRVWRTPKGSLRFSLDFVKIKAQIDAGNFSAWDRAAAEKIMPGSVDFITGKIDRLPPRKESPDCKNESSPSEGATGSDAKQERKG